MSAIFWFFAILFGGVAVVVFTVTLMFRLMEYIVNFTWNVGK